MNKYKTKHFLNYLRENLRILIREILEYKANTYSIIFSMSFFTIINFFMMYLLHNSIGDVIGWAYSDYLLLSAILTFFSAFVGLFMWSKNLEHDLTSGFFNLFLNKPGNIFLNYYIHSLSSWAFISFFIRSITLIGIILVFQIEFANKFLVFLSLILFMLYFLSMSLVLESFAFHMKKSNQIFQPIWNIDWNFFSYPAPFLKKYYSKLFLFMFPAFFGGSLIIPLIKGGEVWNITLQFTILISMTIIFSSLTMINWKTGLKKYEAFG